MRFLIDAILGFFSALTELYGNRFCYIYHEIIFRSNKYFIAYSVRGNRKIFHRELFEVMNDDNEIKNYSPKCVKSMITDYISLAKLSSYNEILPNVALHKIKTISEPEKKCLLPLSCAYVSLLITAIFLSPNMINIGGFIEPRGILIFPATYIIADIISEIYKIKYVVRLIYTTLFILLILALMISVSLLLPAVANNEISKSYHLVFDGLPKLLIANIIAILASDMVNAKLFDKIRAITGGSYLWLRVLGASTVAELIFTFTWIFLYFYLFSDYSQSIFQLAVFALDNFTFKMLYGVLSIPLTYILVPLIRKIDSVEIKLKFSHK